MRGIALRLWRSISREIAEGGAILPLAAPIGGQ